jgi:Mg2+-importing ATPase
VVAIDRQFSHYWSQSVDAVLTALESAADGLSTAEASRRLARYGPNTLQSRRQATAWQLWLHQFTSPIVLILLFATAVSALLQDWADAAIIVAIVLVSALLSFVQEYHASNATERLRARLTIKATVLRDGQPRAIPAEEVVPGDVVLLSAGSLIPADGLVLDARDLFVNQAVLTGETFPVEKQPGTVAASASLAERTNSVFMGTSVSSGSARVVIVQTGAATAFGQIAARLSLRPPETEFQHGIRRLGYLLMEATLILVLIVFAVNVFFQKPILDSFLFALALAVGLTPQLLPAIINVTLARGAQVMAAHGVIVRRLASIENFGSMDVLCTDKTGTLTEGVVRLDGALDVAGAPSAAVFRAAYLNAHLQTGLANPLDEAIVAHAQPEIAAVAKVDEVPYDFVRKRLSVVVQDGPDRVLITKGALENVLAVCAQVQDGQAVVPLDDAHRAPIRQRFAEWSRQGLRVLGVATRSVPVQPAYQRDDERDLTFIGFLLFADPPKSGVKETLADLAELGVQLKIITGDNRLVAIHTAETLGLAVTGVLTGADLHALRDEALWQAATQANLFVEVEPNQKERIILALRKMGHVVGYLGDGINDAPALHAAAVGISVEGAVDVAREAADLVLVQRDLAVLRQGIIQGRITFANTLKYVFMATSANFGNMFSVAGASLFLPFLPLLPKQILLINFLTDLPEMTIAGDTVDPVFVQQPHRWDIGFIRRFMLVFGPLSSVFDYLTFGALLLLAPVNQAVFHTGWFVESVVSAALVVLVVRTRLPATRSRPSRPLLAATCGVVAAALLIPYLPIAGPLGLVPLPPLYLLVVAAIVAAYLVTAELAKRWFYRRPAARRPADR